MYPVLDVLPELKAKLANHPVVILQAPPGAGKSTVLPLELRHEPWLAGKKIMMLEPRRLAARSVAMRMASTLGEEVSKTVGYRVRFDTAVSKNTIIEVVTEGILTRMIQKDNALSDVGLVIFDEFHERSLHADLSLALCLQIQQVLRSDLRLLIMSATFDAQRLSMQLDNAPVVTSMGKQHPVSIHYLPPDSLHTLDLRHVGRAIARAKREHRGDILVFLPGAGEINRVAEALAENDDGTLVFPLYGDLPYNKQQEAILPDPSGRRKVILATSIAETSLTIEGVGIVIDSGYARTPRFNPRSGFTRLEMIRVTKDAADQRAGRAGRLGPGVCFRLWSESIHATLIPNRVPEILEADLAPMMLEIKAWGVDDVKELQWVTPPPAASVFQAIELLARLKALEEGKITKAGQAMLNLPTHPRIAHMLVEAARLNEQATTLATDLAAILEERDPMRNAGADASLRIDVLRKFRAKEMVNADRVLLQRIERLAQSWRKIMKVKEQNDHFDETIIGRLLFYAYPERVAKIADRSSARYKMLNGRHAKLDDHDPLSRYDWLSVADVDEGTSLGKIFLAAPLDVSDLADLADEKTMVRWDDERSMIVSAVEKQIGPLTISQRPTKEVDETLIASVWVGLIAERGLGLLNWDDSHDNLIARVMSLRKWRPTEPWPDMSKDTLAKTADAWLVPFLGGVRKLADLKKLDVREMLRAILPWELASSLDRLAPERIEVPSGSMIKLQYSSYGEPPVMEVRLQELFGLADTPVVNQGAIKVMLHLLSPGYKPVQVTQDLKSFWNNTYKEVRKELRTRYPKHSWPEDPWTAEAIRGAKKRA